MQKLRDINKCLVDTYDVLLSQKSNKRQTVHTLGLKVGDVVWIRVFKVSKRLKYMKHLLPSWKLAKIVRINGMASLLCRDLETQRLISRHLQDCAPVKQVGNFSNLLTDTITGRSHEIEEDFGGLEADKVPNLDGRAVDHELSKAKPPLSDVNEPQVGWKGRLRPRKDKDS